MAGRLVAQGALTIMDFSDAIISSTPPSNPFENMTWIDTSQNPPVHKIYKYFYDDKGNKIGEGWVELGETLPIPPGIAFGGYLTCKITFKAGSTGGIEISSGYFSNNKVPKTIISTNCRIVTQLTSNKGRTRFIIFTNKDTSLTYKQIFGVNNSFLIAVRQNGRWYYEGQRNALVEFTPKSDYCNVGKIVEYSPSEKGSGIKEIIMYAEDPESMFNLLTGEGERQGMFKTEDGKVFINGEYINAKNLKVVDTNNNTTLHINEQGEVTIRATDFSLEGKTIGDMLSEMEIGGRNFHLGSEKWSDSAFTAKTGSTIEGNVLTVQSKKTVDSCYMNVEAGEEYTFSVDMKTTTNTYNSHTYLIQYYNNSNTRLSYEWNTSQLTTSWKRFSQTFTIPSNVTKVNIGYRSDSTTLISYRYPKFEKGNKATDWTPAPEDLRNEMNNAINLQKQRIDDILNDSNLTASEKRQLQIMIEDIKNEYENITKSCTRYGVDCTELDTYYNDLNSYLEQNCAIYDLSITTGVDKDTLKGYFLNYYQTRETIYELLDTARKTLLDNKLSSTDSEAVFNTLTNNGKKQGLYMRDGNFYFNGQYVNAKNLKVVDNNNNTTLHIKQDGTVAIRATEFSLEGKTIDSYISDVNTTIDGVSKNVTAQKERIDEMLADGTLSISEKRQLQRVLKDIEQEYTELSTIAQTYNIDINNFYAMYNTLRNYLTIDCKINDLTVSTGILKNTVQTCFENYYTERANIAGQVNSKVDSKIEEKLSASDSEAVFNTLTDSGKKQGLYLQDGNFYFNGQYINAKNLSVKNADGETTLSIDSNGNVSILATVFKLGGKTITDIIAENTVVTMKRVSIQYYISTSPTTLSGGNWSTTKPTWVSGKYIWQKTVTTYSDNTTAESEPVCITGPQGAQGTPGGKGDQGVSVTKISNRYGTSTSKTTKPTTWYTSYPSWTKGTYIWTKSIISYSNGTTTETEPYVDTSWEGMSNLVDSKVDNNQAAVFNALTNNGQEQGIYLKDGKVYVNGTYIKANTVTGAMLQGDSIDGKTITGATLEGCRIFAAKDANQTDGHKFRIYADGRIYSNNFIQCYGETPSDNKYSELNDGFIVATEYVKSPAIKTTGQNLYFGINDVAVPGSGSNTDRLRFCEISNNKFFMPDYNATSSSTGVRLGASGHMWSTVYAKGGVNSSSDRTVKKNIRYLNAENDLATQSEDINEKDLYNFVRDDLMVAEYNFIGEERTEIGFIAQDILYNLDGSDNKVGQILVNKPDEEQSPLTYSEKTYSNILAGALRQAINKIESLEKRVEELEKK